MTDARNGCLLMLGGLALLTAPALAWWLTRSTGKVALASVVAVSGSHVVPMGWRMWRR